MMHTKSGYSEHRLKSGNPSAWHQKKGRRGFCDGLGLFFGDKSWEFMSLRCKIGECKSVRQVAGVACPSGRATH